MSDTWDAFPDATDAWAGFPDATPSPAPARRKRLFGNPSAPVTEPVDGDTVRTEGPNLRLWGVDAPELRQPGYDRQHQPSPVGEQSRKALEDYLQQGTALSGPIAMQSFGRPVAPITVQRGPFGFGSFDAGQQMVRSGNAVAAPGYVDDPAYQFQLTQAERLARLNGLGPMNDNAVERPEDYRKAVKGDSDYVAPRETVAQFWDTPTPRQGLSAEVEQGYMNVARDGSAADILAYAKANGFNLDPVQTAEFVKVRDAGADVDYVATYAPEIPILTDAGDGAAGATVRGVGKGFLAGGLDELGAAADTLGGTPGRESVWNSDRRLADIWANNQRQNSSILGYDEMAHPYASYGGEIGGALVSGFALPIGAGARTVPQLAKVGGAWGATEGFLGTDGELGQRLTGAAIGAPVGAVVGAAGGKAIEVLGPPVMRRARRAFGKGRADGTGEAAQEGAQGAAQRAEEWDEFPDEVGSGEEMESPAAPGGAATRNSVAMEAERMPGASARQRDIIDVSARARPGRMDQPLTEAQRSALAQDMRPQDVLPMPANTVDGVEEAAATDAGRIVPAKALNEKDALEKRTVRNWVGQPVPKVGPVDLVGFLRLRGGINDAGDAVSKGGDLKAMGITNASRKGLEFVGQEHRFGPMLNDKGMSLDEAALQAWEAGYFPDHLERPTINEFLDALGETYNGGTGRRFLPEDMPEIETYGARQTERYDIEQQEIEAGGPVYLDRSVPAEEPRPFPPAEAYDDRLADTATRAGNIRLDRLESPQDIKRALVQTERTVGFDAATRGKITQAETEALAADLNMTADDLLKRRKGQALNAEEALAARQILAKSGNELVNLARRIQRMDNPGDEEAAAFQRALLRHVAIQEQVSGATAEAGRALAQFRMMADSRAVRKEVLASMANVGGGPGRVKDAAEALLDAVEDGAGKFNTRARQVVNPRFADKQAELFISFVLSRPTTHIVNTVSNTITALAQLPEHAAAGLIGGARRFAARKEVDRIMAGEVGARAFGLIQGAKEGAHQFAKSLKTGEPSDTFSKIQGHEMKAIGGLKGEVIRTPLRLLTAEDELFKGMARRMEINGLAHRQAHKEGLTGEAFNKRVAELSSNPTDEIMQQALDYGRYLTFQRPLEGLGQKVSQAVRENPWLRPIVTFVRTPVNLLSFAVERSPAAPFVKRWRADFKAGGARRDLAIARATLGTGFGLLMYQAALEGKITGAAPSDAAKNRFARADGWQPYSMRIGDQWVSYSRLDPFAMTIGVAADLATKSEGMTDRQLENYSMLMVASIMEQLGDKTFLSGVSDFVQALGDTERYGPSYLRRLGASYVVPNLVNGIAQGFDPVARERGTFAEELQSRIPGASDDLLPRRDIWGRPIEIDYAGWDFVSPFRQSAIKDDPVNGEMLAIGARNGPPSEFYTVEGERQKYTPEQYDRLQELRGQSAYSGVAALISDPAWRGKSAAEKRKAIDKVFKTATDTAKGAVLSGGSGADDPWSAFPDADAGGAGADDPWSSFPDAAGRDVQADLERAIPGVQFTSGFRDVAYNQDLKARGYQAADNSEHLDGAALDMLPPPGKSLSWLRAQVKGYDPKARLLVHDGHLHAGFDDYYGAPVLGGARSAGVVNPNVRKTALFGRRAG